LPQPLYSDTTPEALSVWLELLRKMPEGEKLASVFEMIDFARQMAAAGVRMRYPEASDGEVDLRVAALYLNREEMIRVYRWDPQEHA